MPPGTSRVTAGWRRREIGAGPEPFGGQDVDADTVSPVTVGEPFGRSSFKAEAAQLNGGNEAGGTTGRDASVAQHIEIGRDAGRSCGVFDGVQVDHLTANEGPFTGPQFGELDERIPQSVVVAGKRW